jgi:hypothetical protein
VIVICGGAGVVIFGFLVAIFGFFVAIFGYFVVIFGSARWGDSEGTGEELGSFAHFSCFWVRIGGGR